MGLRRLTRIAVALLVAAATHAAWNAHRFRPEPSSSGNETMTLRGALHVHSSRSDGAGDLDAIAAAAAAAGLDYVILTDHRDLEALGSDEYREGVLLLKGVEISTERGHVLALGIAAPEFRFDGEPRNVFADVDYLGGFTVVAHPRARRRERRWTDEGPTRFDAIELLSASEDLLAPSWRVVAGTLWASINPRYGLLRALGPIREKLDVWDRALAESPGRRVVGLAGADAHRSYRDLFQLFSNHVALDSPLSGDAIEDAELILRAIRDGRCYVALDAIGDARGFSMTAMGDRIDLPASLLVQAPSRSRIELLRDGVVMARAEGRDLRVDVRSPGVYRAEVYHLGDSPSDPSIPWILSNPVYAGVDLAPEAAVGPEAPREAGVDASLRGAATESDHRSRVGPPRFDDDGTLAFDFEMGDVEIAEGRSYCALVAPPPAGLEGASAVSFSYRATSVIRFDVQLRDHNPDAVSGVETFRTSLRTSTEWQDAYVPFEALTSYHPRTDGTFDASRARGIAFYLDTAIVPPGASGTLWVRGLRLH